MNANLSHQDKNQIKHASDIALLSLLNLTLLPVISFLWLLVKLKSADKKSFAYYHLQYALKLNVCAAVALILVSVLMIVFGGFYSAWTWVFVITYFIFVHTVFIVIAVWALIRSWSGNKMGYKQGTFL
ncbi:MAG: Na+(H+)/acetate symporter ActP [Paraglaciecola sp.]|jgi:Na+(H+)/acetate symporter ActP